MKKGEMTNSPVIRTARPTRELMDDLQKHTTLQIVDLGYDVHADGWNTIFFVFKSQGEEFTAEARVRHTPTIHDLLPVWDRVLTAHGALKKLDLNTLKESQKEFFLDNISKVMNEFNAPPQAPVAKKKKGARA